MAGTIPELQQTGFHYAKAFDQSLFPHASQFGKRALSRNFELLRPGSGQIFIFGGNVMHKGNVDAVDQ